MISLEWNEDMRVGIDEIDAEHKNILSIIALIIEAIDTNANAEAIEQYFSDLAFYTAAHFKHEETVMQGMMFDGFIEHQQIHQAFLDKIPELKKQILDSENPGATEQVSQFLYDWVIEHILISDMDYVHAFHREKKHTISLKTVFQSTSEWLSYRVNISKRLLITSLLPIIGMLILSFIAIKDNYLQYKNMQLLENLTQIGKQVNSLTHSLQIERGLLSSYISSDYKRFSKALAARRQQSDHEIHAFSILLKSRMALLTEPELIKFISSTKTDIAELVTFRSTLMGSNIAAKKMLIDYNKIIARLLSLVNHLYQVEMNAKFTNNITAINAIVRLKDMLGQQRDIGTLLIDNKQPRYDLVQSERYKQLYMKLGMQLHAILIFNYSATPKQQQACANLCDINEHKAFINKIISDFILQPESKRNSQFWFIQLTHRIDAIKVITDNIISDLEAKTKLKLNKLEQRFHLVLIIISIISTFNILLFTLLYHSVITPIRRVTYALKQVTLGRYNQQINGYSSKDEIGAMYNAYETLRRKLLQADMSKSIIKRQQQSLLDRRQERDKYRELASRDALTAALNRRKFNHILKQEIGFAKQDKQKLSLLLLDIDHFKSINDNFGHAGGDQVLREFYDTCSRSVKSSDVVARIGGEEFAILMPETNSTQAQVIAERVRHNISKLKVVYGQDHIRLTVSIGLAQWHECDSLNAQEFIAHTDKVLYQAKNNGRNCVKKAD
ncbi:bacteriohemerythrin [Moritella viscosa]|uniref:diguanylate cyclase n=1 Tax=Moritella viscosa TaxID=80854 RepID=A0A1L0C1P0_9GAMM|nr:bacteriohemerythrin [Moritella viscosa]SGZ07132.1 GGDEF domain protein [Moritella viscosa]